MAANLDLLVSLNPWWNDKKFETGIVREKYFAKIKKYLDAGEILVLNGVRRSGKTTLLFQIIDELIKERKIEPKKILFINCDEPALAGLKKPLETLIETYRKEVYSGEDTWIILDEVQNIEGWENLVKSYYDKKLFRIIISGSSSYLLDSKLSVFISGRYLPVSVFPLDFSEYLQFKGYSAGKDPVTLAAKKYEIIAHLKNYLRYGGFPQVALNDDNEMKNDYLKVYYDSIVYRDIVRVQNIRNQKALNSLLAYFFSNFTSIYSYKNISEILGTDYATIKEYIHFAEMAKILFEERYFSYSLKVQEKNQKKIYCIDNGLRNAVSFSFSRDEGRLAENLVYIELIRRGNTPYYWKKQGSGKEVDFVLKNKDDSLTALNVTYAGEINNREKEGLLEFGEEFSKAKDLILLTKDIEKEENGIRMIPLWKWLLFPE
jgi:uncharacterized protein